MVTRDVKEEIWSSLTIITNLITLSIVQFTLIEQINLNAKTSLKLTLLTK
jgi:hypothetical protein